MVLNFASFPEFAEQVSRDPSLIFLSGILLFVAGLAIVRVHNVWVGGWPVLVTVLGWVAILSGLARMLFPTQLAAIAAAVAQKPGGIIAGAIILLVLGAFLSFKGLHSRLSERSLLLCYDKHDLSAHMAPLEPLMSLSRFRERRAVPARRRERHPASTPTRTAPGFLPRRDPGRDQHRAAPSPAMRERGDQPARAGG
jgi:hypothetical protein